jgi:S-adenosylmethionine hydrolase
MIGPPRLVAVLSDFGMDDTYVGQMKGVIAGICPSATVIDLTHAVLPQQVSQGAYLLETALDAFPSATVYLAVVDPGVGTSRRGIAVHARFDGQEYFFVGPDNGLLSCALPPDARPRQPAFVTPPESVQVVTLNPPADRPISPTFHGRDIFAVAAAHLASGEPIERLGDRIDQMMALPPFLASASASGVLLGTIVHIDRFGNVVTTVHASQLGSGQNAVRIENKLIPSFVRTYGDGAGLVALIGSSGYLEVAEVNGNAAVRLGARIGDRVTVELG